MKAIFKPAVRGLVNALDAGIGNKTAAELAEKVAKNYTRPDAPANLRKGGVKPKMDRQPRTIQGPLPPRLDNREGLKAGYKSKEEAVMAGDKYYTKDGVAKEIRNYGSYKGGYTGGSQTKAARKNSLVTSKGARKDDAATQTPPDRPGFNDGGPADPEIDAHHRAGLKMYRPFFEGLEDAEIQQLIKYLENKGVFTGNQPGNRMDMPKPEHNALHKFMREDSDIEYSATELAKKYNFKDMPLKQRLAFLDDFVEWMQGAADEEAYKLMSNRSKLKEGRSNPK